MLPGLRTSGDRDVATACLTAVINSIRPAAAVERAFVFAQLGLVDSTVAWSGRACADRYESVPIFLTDAQLDFLRDHPRFRSLMQRVGLDPDDSVAFLTSVENAPETRYDWGVSQGHRWCDPVLAPQ